MSACVAAREGQAPAKPAWRAVWSLGLGVFGLITAEFLPARPADTPWPRA
ncbi:purine ribonucleoside efflux pump nepI [Enterobacter cancerogenus]|uniref:Purine ribonucleoside efflux pump nepI n=1 Tax=Enterobacter cancerogenus TaxID=69218 RepID=A0A484W5G5_9ENTR|nr:purine ribonucleoside efflux pump nepI [Enterobacter cancerogenus]